ncbi:MAG: hypothetical protein LBR13_06370 [Dysgonamonadaceae bacterium]|jgi:hypothetical protein|nr:hypothetical protein [Dysgonamonadaceae bacterium]
MATVTVSFDKRNALASNLFNAMKLSGVFSIKEKTPARKLSPLEISLQESKEGKVNHYASVDDFFKKMGI